MIAKAIELHCIRISFKFFAISVMINSMGKKLPCILTLLMLAGVSFLADAAQLDETKA